MQCIKVRVVNWPHAQNISWTLYCFRKISCLMLISVVYYSILGVWQTFCVHGVVFIQIASSNDVSKDGVLIGSNSRLWTYEPFKLRLIKVVCFVILFIWSVYKHFWNVSVLYAIISTFMFIFNLKKIINIIIKTAFSIYILNTSDTN